MEPARPRILDDFPTPVAYSYALIFDRDRSASVRRWALCFTEYQALRLIGLPLVSQYLRAELDRIDLERDPAARNAIHSINAAIAGIRAPFFSDWITLVETLRSWLPALKLVPLFPALDRAVKSLRDRKEPRPLTLPGEDKLDPLRAILALRNATAHGGIASESEAENHLDIYLMVLHQVLEAFDFLGDCRLLVRQSSEAIVQREELVRELRGARPGPPVSMELPDALMVAFAESPAALVGPDGRVEPLYPLLNPKPENPPNDENETVYLYDGHYGIRVQAKGETVEKGHIHYLGVHHRVLDTPSCDRMKELLQRRNVHFYLPKEKVAPWTIAETAADYSRQTLASMRGTKYLPACYVPFPDLERHFDTFLAARPPRVGLVLTGLAGSGKSAFLARRVERLMQPPTEEVPQDRDVRENPNLVFFLRGDGIAPREGGVSLYRDVAEKLGVSTAPGSGMATFGELLDHLNRKWKDDRVKGRRLILVIDALNEAPEPRQVLAEALAMIEAAVRFAWCKIVVSTRLEWLTIWSGKQTAQEAAPLERARRCLYYDETRSRLDQPPEPTVGVEPFTVEQAAEVYGLYQAGAAAAGSERLPACPTPWEALAPATRGLLVNPLYLHLFMATFDGRPAEALASVPELFRRYVEEAVRAHPGLSSSIAAVVGHLLGDLTRPTADLTDDDVNAIRERWARSLTVEERPHRLHPVEDLAHEGWVLKRVREEGGGYRFAFQALAEYLIYRDLLESGKGADELAYWSRRAEPPGVFPEYAGAFGFLFRDWARQGKLGLAGRIVEASPRWFDDALVGFLVEQAKVEHAPGRASPHAEAAAHALADAGGLWTSQALDRTGLKLANTRFTPEAIVYYREALRICEALWAAHPDHVSIGEGLGGALSNLGILLSAAGSTTDAEHAYRRSVEIREALWAANPKDVGIGNGLGMALNNLGNLLRASGRTSDAEHAYRRGIEIHETLWATNPGNLEIGYSLGGGLNNLGVLLRSDGRTTDAERTFRRSVEIYEALWAANPENINIGNGLGMVQNNLGVLLSDAGRTADAERAYHRSVEIYEALWSASPNNVAIGNALGGGLNNLGILLHANGRTVNAENAFRRGVEISESLWVANPDNVAIGDGLGRALSNLGNWQHLVGRTADAEHAYRRGVEIYEALRSAHPENIGIGTGLGRVLNNLGILLRAAGRPADAERAYRRGVEVYEAFWATNPENIEIGTGLGRALSNQGGLLYAAGRTTDAEHAYRRSVEILEALWAANPKNVGIGDGLGKAMNNLGNLLSAGGRTADAEHAFRRSVVISETLWTTNPENIDIGDGLSRALYNLGNLLSASGRTTDAEHAYRRSVDIREVLWAANPHNVEITAGYAGSLCSVGRWDDAKRRVDEVLALIPTHPYANQLRRLIAANRPSNGA